MSNPNDPSGKADVKMTPEELRFEQALDRGEKQIGATAELQDRIDDSLRRSFAPRQAPTALLNKLREAERVGLPPEPAAQAVKKQRLPSWAVAAVLMLGVASWLFSANKFLNAPPSEYARVTAADMYLDAVHDGFEPDWFCKDEKRFADTFTERQGEGVWLRPLPVGTRMAGLAYREGFTENTTCLLAWAEEQPVLVLVARTSEIEKSQLDNAPGLNIFKQRLGNLTLVEVSKLEMPVVSPALYLREAPAQPTGRVPGAGA